MKFGITIFVTDETPSPGRIARAVENHGFESLWMPDHTHMPVSHRSVHPLEKNELPREYLRNLEAFVALTAAAEATERLLLGTAVCLVPERDPITTAKVVASLDHLSHGRVLFGVGAGWNLEELGNHGIDPATRFAVLTERMEAMKTIWTDDVASFHGKYVDFDRIWSWPKPVQRPHPPVLLGANGPRAVDRALAMDAHWMPGRHRDDNALLARITDYLARSQGRLGVTLTSPALDASQLARFAEAGVERSIFFAPSASMDQIERRLAEIRRVTASLDPGHCG